MKIFIIISGMQEMKNDDPKSPSLLSVLASLLLLPFVVIIIVPYFLWSEYGIDPVFDFHLKLGNWRFIPGILLVISGIALMYWTIRLFYQRGKGTLAPWDPPKKLVIAGPYKLVRNPMITGVLCLLLAEAILMNSNYILCWFLIFFVVNHLNFLFIEERQLKKRYDQAYINYLENVPRWIPKINAIKELLRIH